MATPRIQYSPQEATRARVLGAAKHLFFVIGYENTTLHAICREARVTENVISEDFGSKEDMLRAIFEEGWNQLIARLTRLQEVTTPHKRLKNLARSIVQMFGQDTELRDLILTEGRRMNGTEMMILTPSYTDLVALVDALIIEASPSSTPHQVQLLRSSLLGAVEGVLRDLASQERSGYPASFTLQQAEQFLPEVVGRLIPSAA